VLTSSVNRHFMTSTYFSWTTDFINIGYNSPNLNCQCMDRRSIFKCSLLFSMV